MATATGVISILLALVHLRRITAWVDTDAFGTGPVPTLPDDKREYHLATAAVIIGIVVVVSLLTLP